MCGGTSRWVSWDSWDEGLSPRVRGNPRVVINGKPGQGSIPACAGEPASHSDGLRGLGAGLSPRVRGNRHAKVNATVTPFDGLSPRVRGNPRFSPGGLPSNA